ncbi:MAG: PD-(D/E)XK nuclease family protein [bacterium]|nr:PD-(D/E)XK nuclease family protein [bacterium]
MLKELIDKFYLEQEGRKNQLHFYITDAGKCQRAVFFKFKNVSCEKTDPRLLRIFEHGELLHRNIFNILYRLKIGVTTEVKIPEQELISGRADAILCLAGENYVLDIKSINSMAFRKLMAPKEENLYQIQLYLHYFKIKKGILLYIDKDRQEIKEFIIIYDVNLVSQLLIGFEQLKKKIETDTLPVTLFDYPTNWQCSYCQYRQICDMAGKQEIPWHDFKTRIQLADEA